MTDYLTDQLRRLEARVTALERQLVPDKGPAPERARQLPKGWQPTEETLAWAMEKFPSIDEPGQREKFIDYYGARDEARRDWQAAYRGWIRKEFEYLAKTNGAALQGRTDSRTTRINQINSQRLDSAFTKLAALRGNKT